MLSRLLLVLIAVVVAVEFHLLISETLLGLIGQVRLVRLLILRLEMLKVLIYNDGKGLVAAIYIISSFVRCPVAAGMVGYSQLPQTMLLSAAFCSWTILSKVVKFN